MLSSWWHVLTLMIYVAAAAVASAHALLRKRDPRAAFGWIGVCWLLPVVGAGLYAVFGINRVETHGRRLRGLSQTRSITPQAAEDQHLPLTQLQRLGGAVSGLPLLAGNAIQPLRDGDQAYPAMLEAISGAMGRVWLASYIFDTKGWCGKFVETLHAAQQRGVEVRVLVDGFGEYYSLPHAVPALRRRGITAERFLPPRVIPPSLSLNLRNHRKLLIVDDHIAFAGGMNIANRHLTGDRGLRMHDLHFRLSGPVVAQLAAAFQRDWAFSTGENLRLPSPAAVAGDARCRVISDGPDEDIDKLVLLLISAIAAANTRVSVMTPYFLPPRELLAAFQAAVLRGVDVEILLPQRSNLRFVDWAAQHDLMELLRYGVRIHLSPPPFAHDKLLLVDDIYALIGSANLDPRSLRLNFEIGVEIFDAPLVKTLRQTFSEARDIAIPLRPETLARLSLPHKLRNGVCWLFSPYL